MDFLADRGAPQATATPPSPRPASAFSRCCCATSPPSVTASFAPVAPLEMELVKLETNPRLMQLGAAAGSDGGPELHRGVRCASGRIDWLLPETLLAPFATRSPRRRRHRRSRKHEAWATGACRALAGGAGGDAGDSRAGPDQPAGTRTPVTRRHHPHRIAATVTLLAGEVPAVSRPLRGFAGS